VLDSTTLNAYLGGSVNDWPDGSDALKALAFEAGAVGEVESGTRRTYRAAAALAEWYGGSEEPWLELRHPVASGTPVVYIGESTTPYDASLYDVQANPRLGGLRNILRLKSSRWGYTNGNDYRITYSGGYTAGAEPAEIRMLVGRLTALRFTGTPVATAAKSENGDEDLALPADLQRIMRTWTWTPAIIVRSLLRAS
jgi:hypothetical protein